MGGRTLPPCIEFSITPNAHIAQEGTGQEELQTLSLKDYAQSCSRYTIT